MAVSVLRGLEAADPKAICWALAGLDFAHQSVPENTALALFERFTTLGAFAQLEWQEAAASLLEALAELLNRREEDKAPLRELLRQEVSSGQLRWLQRFLELMAEPATSAAPFAGPARACEVLELLCRGQEELTTLLHRQHVLLAVSSRLLAATAAQPAPNWRPYAALMVGLLEALMAEKDTERFRLADPALFIPVWSCRRQEVTRQALLAVLEEGGATMLHASALRALTHLAKHSSSEAAMLRRHAGLGLELMARCACDEEKLVIALEFLVTVRAKADAAQVSAAAARLPRSQRVQELAKHLT